MNESIAFNCRKLIWSNIMHTCHTREGIVHIKHEESRKPFKIFYISKLYELVPNFVFVDDKKGDVNTFVLSSYWLIITFVIHKGYLVASSCLGSPRAVIKYLIGAVNSVWVCMTLGWMVFRLVTAMLMYWVLCLPFGLACVCVCVFESRPWGASLFDGSLLLFCSCAASDRMSISKCLLLSS